MIDNMTPDNLQPMRVYFREPYSPLRPPFALVDEFGDVVENIVSIEDRGGGHYVFETYEISDYDSEDLSKGNVITEETITLYGVETTYLDEDEVLPGEEGFAEQQISKRLKATIDQVLENMVKDMMAKVKDKLFTPLGMGGFHGGGPIKLGNKSELWFRPSEPFYGFEEYRVYKASDEDGDWDLGDHRCQVPIDDPTLRHVPMDPDFDDGFVDTTPVVPKVEDMPMHVLCEKGIFAPYEADVDQVWLDGELVYKKPLTGIKMRGEPKTLEIDLGDLPPGVAVTVEFKAEDLQQGKFSIRYDETEPDAENEIVKLKIDLDASEAMAEIRDLMEDLQQQMRDVMAISAEMLQARDEDVRSRMEAFSRRMEGRIRKSSQRNM